MPNANANNLDKVVNLIAGIGNLRTPILHRIVFCSFLKAGLSLYKTSRQQHEVELNNIMQKIPPPYRALVNGKLYLSALSFLKSYQKYLKNMTKGVLLKEANLHYILNLLKTKVGKVGAVIVLDCASIPEILTLAGKFRSLRHHSLVLQENFVNPVGITRFLTEQLTYFGQIDVLRGYAQLIKQTLGADFGIKSSTIDLTVHTHGIQLNEFLSSLNIDQLFSQINFFAKQNSVLVTSDHGYDIVADEQGLYITHGHKKDCPINFSKIALFLIID